MRLILSAVLALTLMQSGCYTATMKAADFQPYVDSERIQPGITLVELERILGEDGAPIDGVANAYEFRFEDTDAWSGRRWLYWIFEVPTVGLASIATLPIEFAIERDAQRWGTALFDESGGLVLFRAGRRPITVVATASGDLQPSRPGHFGEYLNVFRSASTTDEEN
jgi:hypothetical protein